MAYMLSAQLAAMKLDIAHGFVDPSAYSLCAGKTIGQLVLMADALLAADGYTPAGDPNRAMQEAAKNCLDALNNGALVIPSTPCNATFPSPSQPLFGISSQTVLNTGSWNVKAMFP
jgi:hypothetical protein